MQRGLRNIAIVVSIVQFYLPLIADTHRSEEALFAQIQLHAEAGESSRVHAFGNEFHKKYPLSKRRGDVYLLMAKNAITVDSALTVSYTHL
ncbi:MAG: hypothetical protein N2316_07600, partial [Spirochaetes bacterium]|nr:hypothetical protein [Spirochaetota bacterium]